MSDEHFSPEDRLLYALYQLGFDDDKYEQLAEAIENLLGRHDGVAIVTQTLDGPKVRN